MAADADEVGSEGVGGGSGNIAKGIYATVSGGFENTASDANSAVGGGQNNTASGEDATVGGSDNNTASGPNATVPGGFENRAAAGGAFAAGARGKAESGNTFVWDDNTSYHDTDGDGTADGLSSNQDIAGSGVTGSNTFYASSTGGFRFITGDNSVTYISGGSTGWSTTSTRAAKTNIDPVEPKEVLTSVEKMEVATWEYKDGEGGGEGVRHMGPMAEAFHSAFDLGPSDTGINSINADGVAFAAIQGLSQQLDEKDDRIEELEDEVNGLRVENEELKTKNEEVRAENERLHERLDAVEDRLAGIESDGSSGTAADD